MASILPRKAHSACHHPLPHLWASSHLLRRSTRILPWTCTVLFTQLFFPQSLKSVLSSTIHMLMSVNSRNLRPLIKSLISSSPCTSLLIASKPGLQRTMLNSTTRLKLWLYHLVASLGLSLPPFPGSMTIKNACVPMSDCQKLWCYTWFSLDDENAHFQSCTLS